MGDGRRALGPSVPVQKPDGKAQMTAGGPDRLTAEVSSAQQVAAMRTLRGIEGALWPLTAQALRPGRGKSAGFSKTMPKTKKQTRKRTRLRGGGARRMRAAARR